MRRCGSCPPEPKEASDIAGAIRQQEEVVVFRHDDGTLDERASPYFRIGSLAQSYIQNMLRPHASALQPSRESDRQLIVYQQPHAAGTTAWSANRAA
jgi:hypothetical protein